MVNITVLGTGAMGSRMAMRLINAGHKLVVWNRTPEAASELVKAGARQAESAREAVKGADFVIAMLRDDEASRQVWLDPENGALSGMEPGAVAIESSTLTPNWIRELGEAVAGRGLSLLEAPVSGSRPQAEAGQLVYLVGGDEATFQRTEPILKAMGSVINFVGPLGTGALVKLSTNALMGIQVATYAELIGLLKHSGVDVSNALQAISKTPVWSPGATAWTTSMLNENFAPQFPVELIEKDFRYALEAIGSPTTASTITAARQVFQEAIAKGLGKENMTSVVKLFT